MALELVIRIKAENYHRESKRVGAGAKSMAAELTKLKGILGGLFAGFSAAVVLNELRQIGQSIVQTGSMFQVLGTQIETAFGGGAEQAMADIRQFALDSPGQVSGITAAWIGLKSVGIEPTIDTMRALDDIASSSLNAATGQARKLEDLAEAIRGAITGETERLKAFNIIARQSGENITLAYKDTEIKVKKSAQEIMDAIVQIGRVNFPGAAQRQMETLSGATSNLQDAWEDLASAMFEAGIGEQLTDAAKGAKAWLEVIKPGAVAATSEFAKALDGLHDVILRNLAEGMSSPLFRVAMQRVLTTFLGAPLAIQTVTKWLGGLRTVAVKSTAEIRAEMDESGEKADWLSEHLDNLDAQRIRRAKEVAEAEKKAAEERAKALDKLIDRVGKLHKHYDDMAEAQNAALLGSIERIPLSGEAPSNFNLTRAGETAARMLDELIEGYVDVQKQAQEEAAEHQVDTWGEAVSTVGLIIEEEWQQMLSHVLGGVLDAIFSGGDIGAALSSGLGDVGGMLGGIFGAQFGPLGTMLGSALGEQAGSLIGDLVGDVLGFGAKLEDAYSTFITEGGRLVENVSTGGGQARGIVDDIVGSVLSTVNNIVGGVGGVIEGLFEGFSVLVNVKDGEIRELAAYVDDVKHVFGSVGELVEFLASEVLSGSLISGLEPEVEAVLRDAAGKPLEQINAEVAAGIRVAAGRMGQDVFQYRAQVREIFADFQTIFAAGGDATAGTLGRLRQMWDTATGQQKSAEQIFAARKKIILAEIDLELARLRAEHSALETQAGQVEIGIEIDRARLLAHHEILEGEAQVVQATAGLAGQLAAIASLISELEIFRGEVAVSQFRPPSIPSVGGGGGGGVGAFDAERQEAARRELEILRLLVAGHDDVVDAMRREDEILRLVAEGLTRAQAEEQLYLESLLDAAEAAEEARRAWEDLSSSLRESAEALLGPSGIDAQIQGIVDQYAGLQQEILDAITEQTPGLLSMLPSVLSGALGLEDVRRLFGDEAADFIAQLQALGDAMDEALAELGQEALAGLGSEILAIEAGSQAAQNQIQGLLDNLELLGLTAEEVAAAARDAAIPQLLRMAEEQAARAGAEAALARFQERRAEYEMRLERLRFEALVAQLELAGALDEELQALVDELRGLFDAPTAEPDLPDELRDAGRDFRESVERAASSFRSAFPPLELINPSAVPYTLQGRIDEFQAFYGPLLGDLVGRIANFGVDVGTKSPFDLMREEVLRLADWVLPAFGLSVEDLMADIDALELAELKKAWEPFFDIIDQLTGAQPGPYSLQGTGFQIAQIQSQIAAAVAAGNAEEATRLARMGLGLVESASSRTQGSFYSFLQGFADLDITGGAEPAMRVEIASGGAPIDVMFDPLLNQEQVWHETRERNRADQTVILRDEVAKNTAAIDRLSEAVANGAQTRPA